jgi:outer membrane protein TolC
MIEKVLVLAVLVAPLAAQSPPPTPLRLTLADAVRRAAADAPAVELAAFGGDAARARVRQARAGLLPAVGLTAWWLNRTFNRASLGFDFPTAPGVPGPPDRIGPFDNVDARVQLTQPLLDWAAGARVRAARAQVTGADAQSVVAAEAAAQAAALAYLRGARAAALVAARRADSGLAAELASLAAEQQAAGVATPLDVTRARAQVVVAREAIVMARNQLDRARVELARALGLEAGTPIELVEDLSDSVGRAPVPAERDRAVGIGLERRPDLAAETARARAAELGARAVSAELLPRLEVAADYGLNGRTVPDAIATRQVRVQVSVPMLDGLRREGRVAEQRALHAEAEMRRRELARDIAAQVETAFLDLESAQAQQAIAAERLRLAEEELAQSRERFSAGVAGNIELITAQISLLDARDAEIEARFAAAAARVELARAVGVARELQ